jgi:PAS domain S-box-containing protein
LSYIVAVLASYTAIDLAGRVTEFREERRKAMAWLAGGALAMGAGVWAMHFVGMLAYRLPIPVQYELRTTLASMAVAIATSGFALFIITRHRFSVSRRLIGGAVMGTGIGIMHYMGMAAMRMDAQLMYYAGPFVLSVVNAAVCSTIALWFVSRRTHTETSRKILAAAVMGVAIAGMHYTGMYATVCVASGQGFATGAALDPKLMALAITVITLLIMGMALAVSLQSQLMTQALSEQNLALTDEIEQRRRVEAELAHHRDNLRALVEARTRDLSQANQSLQESEMRFRATFDHAPVGILQASVKERRILHVNRKLCEMLGYTPNELLCMTTSNLLHRGYDFTESGDLRDSMPGSEAGTQASECVYVRRDGGTLWVNRTISLVRDTVGNPLYFILVAEDITERWRSAQMQAQLAAIVETSNDAIVGRAPDDRIIS